MNNNKQHSGQELIQSPETSLQAAESLPVLAAFNDFIKVEQRRSRNRMLIMGFLFTLIIIVIIGAGVFIGTAFYNQVRADLRQTNNDLNSYHIKTEIEKSKTEDKLAQIKELANTIANSITQQELSLQATRKSINSNNYSYQKELADMKQVIGTLSLENTKLKKNEAEANTKLPALAAQINDLLNIITNPVVVTSTNTPVEEVKIVNVSEPEKLPKIIEKVEPIETNESTEVIEATSNIKLNIENQEDDDDIMMLLPTLE